MSSHRGRAVLTIVALAAQAACGNGENRTAAVAAERAALDTGNALSVTPAEGGVAKLTPTDAKSVYTAGKYKLTNENFHQFIVATDSILSLRARDPSVRSFLSQDITDSGDGTQVTTIDAGEKRLENNAVVSNAITSAGMSVRDYFVAAIAIAQAERFMGNPKASVATAALRPNAEFLDAHKAELTSLRARANGAIIVR